ncbi:thioredoxin family protein [uncultured Prevotella sp.]|uniref:thioredoxin family protein n=1 Tax=uncultured Prevotella sp. TaxID=159272 RepID=UPI0025F9EF42|nr:thioredoxin family protein [uncultured Prevotella sp.]
MKHLLFLAIFTFSVLNINAQIYDITENEYVYKVFPNMNKPIVIDFCATWCGPCHQYSAIFNSVANEFYGKADFYRVDIDKNKSWAQQWGIEYIPTTIIIYTKGEKIYRESGVLSKDKLAGLVKKAVSKYKSDRQDYF